MGLLSSLLALLFPSPQGSEPPRPPETELAQPPVSVPAGPDASRGAVLYLAADGFRPPVEHQVRIEQRMTIRISPRAEPPRANLVMDLPRRAVGPRFMERKMGKCVAVSGIVGVEAGGGNQLILFLRDRRMVSASLERACRARDFYSGFYLERNDDGRLCVERDTLLSRSGANCQLTRFRQLVEIED